MIRNTLALLILMSQSAFAEQTISLEPLSIEQAIQLAVDRNHDLRLSAIAVTNAKSSSVIASAAPNPTLTLQTFNINPRAGIGNGSLSNKTFDSTVRESSSYLEDATCNDFQDALRQLRVGVSQSYYDVLAAEEKLAIMRQTAALYDTSVDAAQKRLKSGDIASADVARLQVDASRAQNDAAQAAVDLVKARQGLAAMMGQIAYATKFKLSDSWPTIRIDAVTSLDSLVEGRADVLAVKSRLEAAMSARKLALASRSRDVSVGVQYEHFPASYANPQGSGNSYGIAVQIPLFVRYEFDGEIRAAEAAVDAAKENLEKTRDLARSDLMKDWEDMRAASKRVSRYEESLLPAAKKSADAAEFAFKHGALSIMDVLDVRRTYRATQLDAIAARADNAKSLVAWQANVSEGNTQ
jgi:cobalt-zinc-cadmium efflux system outer membrane protein